MTNIFLEKKLNKESIEGNILSRRLSENSTFRAGQGARQEKTAGVRRYVEDFLLPDNAGLNEKGILGQPGRGYKYGFYSDVKTDSIPKGLSEQTIHLICDKKNEPDWMRQWRLKAYRHWKTMEEPHWANFQYGPIDYQGISYYNAPKKVKTGQNSLDEIDPELIKAFKKLGIPVHAAVVELIALDNAEIKYSTVQNWYSGDKEGKGGIYNFVTKRGKCAGRNSKISWTQVEAEAAITRKYPNAGRVQRKTQPSFQGFMGQESKQNKKGNK